MKKTLLILLAIMISVGLIACSQSPAAPTESSTKEEAPPAPVQTEGQQNNTEPKWEGQEEWEKTVAAAIQEGKLIISAPSGDTWRDPLMTFEKDYPGIKVELTPSSGRDFWARVNQEREVGQYLWDLRVGGSDVTSWSARDEGVIDPIRPLLVLPEILDEKVWLEGFDALFADNDKEYITAFAAYAQSSTFVNRDIVPESELSSDKDLLDPKWKGKIVVQDPRGGAGLTQLQLMLATHGEDFIRDLFTKQDVVVTNDPRQMAEWIVRGQYPIGIGVATAHIVRFQNEGLGKNVLPIQNGAMALNIGVGATTLMNKAPNPNAAKVFVNWILTKEVQDRIMQSTKLNSRRLDVAPGDPESLPDPNKMDQYVPLQIEELSPTRELAQKLASELIK